MSAAAETSAPADQAIATCGGDAREAVKALIVANGFLETQVDELRASVSAGYARAGSTSRAIERFRAIEMSEVTCYVALPPLVASRRRCRRRRGGQVLQSKRGRMKVEALAGSRAISFWASTGGRVPRLALD
jgi:hypothetical protein